MFSKLPPTMSKWAKSITCFTAIVGVCKSGLLGHKQITIVDNLTNCTSFTEYHDIKRKNIFPFNCVTYKERENHWGEHKHISNHTILSLRPIDILHLKIDKSEDKL